MTGFAIFFFIVQIAGLALDRPVFPFHNVLIYCIMQEFRNTVKIIMDHFFT